MKINAVVLGLASVMSFSAFAAPISVSYGDFSDLSDFQLNGTAASLSPNADDVLRLTSTTSQSGSAFLTNAISLQNQASFSSYFTFQIDNNSGIADVDGVGADGIVFTLQTNANTAGGSGGGIGYQGITNSVGIEFDTWNNGSWDDHSGNHVGVNLNGSVDSVTQVHEATRFNNGAEWSVWVDYDGANDLLDVRYALSDTRPVLAALSYTVDLESIFGLNDVFVGFTSGTGGAGGQHDITSFSFTNDFDPIDVNAVPEPASLAIFGLALAGLGFQVRRRKA